MIFQGYGTYSYEPIPIVESNREEQRNRVSDNEEADMDEDNDEDNVENQRFELPKLSIVLSRFRETNKRFTISFIKKTIHSFIKKAIHSFAKNN